VTNAEQHKAEILALVEQWVWNEARPMFPGGTGSTVPGAPGNGEILVPERLKETVTKKVGARARVLRDAANFLMRPRPLGLMMTGALEKFEIEHDSSGVPCVQNLSYKITWNTTMNPMDHGFAQLKQEEFFSVLSFEWGKWVLMELWDTKHRTDNAEMLEFFKEAQQRRLEKK
jgi:hypothetical protein